MSVKGSWKRGDVEEKTTEFLPPNSGPQEAPDIKRNTWWSLWEMSHMLALGQWAGQETPLFPGQPAVFTQLVVIRGMKLTLISSIYCICLSAPQHLKLHALYLSTLDLMRK